MLPRLPRLPTKILVWFFLNVAGLVVAGALFLQSQSGGGFGSIPEAVTNARLQKFAEQLVAELSAEGAGRHAAVLAGAAEEAGVRLALYSEAGDKVAGDLGEVPAAIAGQFRLRPPGGGRPPRPEGGRPSPGDQSAGGPYKVIIVEGGAPGGRWAGLKIPVTRAGGGARPMFLIVRSDPHGGGLFFERRPWIVAIALAIAVSVLFWLPLVLNLARRLRALASATDRIAEGELATRVPRERSGGDEIAKLGDSVNRMAARLEGHVDGQKRFLGDVAHELSSPIARMQAALALLENKVDGDGERHLGRLDVQLQHMGQLVNELLLFSKASLQSSPRLEPAALGEIVARAAGREVPRGHPITLEVDPGLRVLAVPDLLERAVANVLRNSVRYADAGCPIHVAARAVAGGRVSLRIGDSGGGVPEEALPHLFEAFYRPAPAREAESGGAGLGLAIVKSCIESCGGSVAARNLSPRGFEVQIDLDAAP